nr:HIT domain-containing protein [Actinomycetota bacterium]
MERLWSPWRNEYVTSADGDKGCVFCDHLEAGDDEVAHILHRGVTAFAILNAYPYNTGHLMVAPLRHVGELHDLEPDERAELMELTTRATEIIREAMNAHGFNVGMNLGQVAGAGIPGHLHVHVVPRWGGDTNFMPVVGDTKVLPEMVADTDAKLRPLF